MTYPVDQPDPPGQVIQISAVPVPSAKENYVMLFALCADGSIWCLREWEPTIGWVELDRPQRTGEPLPA